MDKRQEWGGRNGEEREEEMGRRSRNEWDIHITIQAYTPTDEDTFLN